MNITRQEKLLLTQFAVDRANDGIIWLKPDGCIVYANETLCKMVGYNAEELYRMNIDDLHSSHEKYCTRFERLKKLGGRAILEGSYRNKLGYFIPVEISGNYLL